jgi:hypothetical protein
VADSHEKRLIEVVGVVAVIASLVFVGYEIRQNTIAARAAAYQAIGVATASAWDSTAHDQQFLEVLYKTPEDMTTADWRQYAAKFTVFARLGETILLQVEQGLLPPDAMDRLGYRPWTSFIKIPKTACIWHLIPGKSDSFRAYVENGRQPNIVNCGDDVPTDSL